MNVGLCYRSCTVYLLLAIVDNFGKYVQIRGPVATPCQCLEGLTWQLIFRREAATAMSKRSSNTKGICS